MFRNWFGRRRRREGSISSPSASPLRSHGGRVSKTKKKRARFVPGASRILNARRGQPPPPAIVLPGQDNQAPTASARAGNREAMGTVLEGEAKAREGAPERWNAAIDPSSEEFSARHKAFSDALQDRSKTLDDILDENFTIHERQMLLPTEKRSDSTLHKLQSDNMARYRALLASDRFKDWAPSADLAFKFTLVYYGLPVAPMTLGLSQTFPDFGYDEEVDWFESLAQDGKPPNGWLRFLNSYSVRHFGKGHLLKPDPMFEKYYAFDGLHPVSSHESFPASQIPATRLTLRGGGMRGDEDSDMVMEERLSESWSVTSVESEYRSGPEEAEELSSVLGLRGGMLSPKPQQPECRPEDKLTPLYGFQGVANFNHRDLMSFVDAFERLLTVDARSRLHVKLAVYERTPGSDTFAAYVPPKKGPASIREALRGYGDYEAEKEMLGWAKSYIGHPEFDEKYALFACVHSEPLPRHWEPQDAREEGVLLLRRDGRLTGFRGSGDRAYLRVPTHDPAVWHENAYNAWMITAARLLLPESKLAQPGRLTTPHAFFAQAMDKPRTYAALSFPPESIWAMLQRWHQGQEVQDLLVHATFGVRGWPAQIPGRKVPRVVLGDTSTQHPDWESLIVKVTEDSLHPAEFAAVTHIDVWLPGSAIYVPAEKGRHTITLRGGRQQAARKGATSGLVEELGRIAQASGGKPESFISISPRFGGPAAYTVFDSANITSSFRLRDETTLDEFLDCVDRARKRSPGSRQLVRGRNFVSISHASCDWHKPATPGQAHIGPVVRIKRSPQRDTQMLSFLVAPDMTDEDFKILQRRITSPNLVFNVVDRLTAEPQFDMHKQIWGHRDIYEISDVFGPEQPPEQPPDRRPGQAPYASDDRGSAVPAGKAGAGGAEPVTAARADGASKGPNFSTAAAGVGTKPKPASKTESLRRKEVRFREDAAQAAAEALPPSKLDFYGLKEQARRRPPSDQEKGKMMREHTWDKAPSVGSAGTIPINAPPVEAILRTGHDSLPAISLGVLTPTEQQRMRVDYYNMRNVALQRSQRCPYPDCKRVFKASDADRLRKHLTDVHAAEKCNFCDDLLYQHWTQEQRRLHFATKHHTICSMRDAAQDEGVRVASLGRVDPGRESLWNFCARCGRDHTILNAPADRTNHDNVCFPHSTVGKWDWNSCRECGGDIFGGKVHTHVCSEDVDVGEKPWCDRCGLPLGLFTPSYVSRHSATCKGHSNVEGGFCPWCGVDLGLDEGTKSRHLSSCAKRPSPDAQGPVDPATGKPWPPHRVTGFTAGGEQEMPAAGPASDDSTGNERDTELARQRNEELAKQIAQLAKQLKKEVGEHARSKQGARDLRKRLAELQSSQGTPARSYVEQVEDQVQKATKSSPTQTGPPRPPTQTKTLPPPKPAPRQTTASSSRATRASARASPASKASPTPSRSRKRKANTSTDTSSSSLRLSSSSSPSEEEEVDDDEDDDEDDEDDDEGGRGGGEEGGRKRRRKRDWDKTYRPEKGEGEDDDDDDEGVGVGGFVDVAKELETGEIPGAVKRG